MEHNAPDFKQKLYRTCVDMVNEKLAMLQGLDKASQEAANNETKSSAGDKYETGRAMAHLEKERLATQIETQAKLKKVLDQIDPNKRADKVGLGSLVQLGDAWYYLSVALGKVELEDKEIFCISPVAPIGKLLLGKRVGDKVSFQGEKVVRAIV